MYLHLHSSAGHAKITADIGLLYIILLWMLQYLLYYYSYYCHYIKMPFVLLFSSLKMNLYAKKGNLTTAAMITTGVRASRSASAPPTTRTRSRRHQTHCTECLGALTHARVLVTCRHVFCLECAHALERGSVIKCPLCHLETRLESSLHVKHLPEVDTHIT